MSSFSLEIRKPDFGSFAGGCLGSLVAVEAAFSSLLAAPREGGREGGRTHHLQLPANLPADSSTLENQAGLKSVSSLCLSFFSLLATPSQEEPPTCQLLLFNSTVAERKMLNSFKGLKFFGISRHPAISKPKACKVQNFNFVISRLLGGALNSINLQDHLTDANFTSRPPKQSATNN